MPPQEKYKFKPRMETTKAVSTKTKSIADFFTPMSERYGDPAEIRKSRTVSKGIPMDTQALEEAFRQILTSEDIQKSGKSQKEIAEQAIGEMLGYRDSFNRRRQGRKFAGEMLSKIARGDKPGGLVAYRTQEGYPTGGGRQVLGDFRHKSSKDVPDTMTVFSDNPSLSYRKSPKNTLHELIHAGLQEREDIREGQPLLLKERSLKGGRLWSRSRHAEPFEKAVDEILKSNWAVDLLRKAMLEKEEDQYQLPKGFIK